MDSPHQRSRQSRVRRLRSESDVAPQHAALSDWLAMDAVTDLRVQLAVSGVTSGEVPVVLHVSKAGRDVHDLIRPLKSACLAGKLQRPRSCVAAFRFESRKFPGSMQYFVLDLVQKSSQPTGLLLNVEIRIHL